MLHAKFFLRIFFAYGIAILVFRVNKDGCFNKFDLGLFDSLKSVDNKT